MMRNSAFLILKKKTLRGEFKEATLKSDQNTLKKTRVPNSLQEISENVFHKLSK